MATFDEKQIRLLQSDLDSLELDDWTIDEKTGESRQTFSPPTIAEYLVASQNKESAAKINQMIVDLPARQLYAAVLLDLSGQTKAQEIFEKLRNDDALVTIAKAVGHGMLSCPVKRLSESYRNENTLRGSYLRKLEKLSNLTAGVWHEAQIQKKSFGRFAPPTFEDVWQAKADESKRARVRQQLDDLSQQGAAKSLYAAFLLEEIDDQAAKHILKTLLTDQTLIWVIFGDIAEPVPASEVAAAILEKREIRLTSNASATGGFETLTNKFFDWLNKQIFKESKRS